jgi:CheY-like chemotaxis protein
MTVLIVDDSPIMRQHMARTLAVIGIDANVIQASDGCEGLRLAQDIRPDLVITDLNMPCMSGAEMLAAIHALPDLHDLPILVLTADRSVVRSGELITAGAAAYLTKPVSPQRLRQSLQALLGEAA